MSVSTNGNVNGMQDKLLKQNYDLIDAIKKSNDEKLSYKTAIAKLEEEIRQYKRNINKVIV